MFTPVLVYILLFVWYFFPYVCHKYALNTLNKDQFTTMLSLSITLWYMVVLSFMLFYYSNVMEMVKVMKEESWLYIRVWCTESLYFSVTNINGVSMFTLSHVDSVDTCFSNNQVSCYKIANVHVSHYRQIDIQ